MMLLVDDVADLAGGREEDGFDAPEFGESGDGPECLVEDAGNI